MKKYLDNITYKFQQFMYGRYGIDELYKILIAIYFLLIVVNVFVKNNVASIILSVLTWAIVIYSFYRVFSKNIEKRKAENSVILSMNGKIQPKLKLVQNKWKFRKTHIFKKCPNCKRVLKLPRKKGSHNVNCPACKTNFKVKVL